MELETILDAIRYVPSFTRLASFFQSMPKEGPDKADVQKQLLEFHGWLIALQIGMRQMFAFQENIDQEVRTNILALCQVFDERPDEVAEGIRQTYPEYDSEIAKMLVQKIAENLRSFLPIRIAAHFRASGFGSAVGNTHVGGDSSPDVGSKKPES